MSLVVNKEAYPILLQQTCEGGASSSNEHTASDDEKSISRVDLRVKTKIWFESPLTPLFACIPPMHQSSCVHALGYENAFTSAVGFKIRVVPVSRTAASDQQRKEQKNLISNLLNRKLPEVTLVWC
jgi:hypothetical protein